MDFQLLTKVRSPDKGVILECSETFYTPDKLMEALHGHMSTWNVLNPDAVLRFTLTKVPNDTPTIGIAVNDLMQLGEQLS